MARLEWRDVAYQSKLRVHGLEVELSKAMKPLASSRQVREGLSQQVLKTRPELEAVREERD